MTPSTQNTSKRKNKEKEKNPLTVLRRDLPLDAVELEDVRGGVSSVGVGERSHGVVGGGEHGEGSAVDLAGKAVLLHGIRERGEAGGSAGVHQVRRADLHGAAASLGRGLAAHGLEAGARSDGLGEGESGHCECGGEWSNGEGVRVPLLSIEKNADVASVFLPPCHRISVE